MKYIIIHFQKYSMSLMYRDTHVLFPSYTE